MISRFRFPLGVALRIGCAAVAAASVAACTNTIRADAHGAEQTLALADADSQRVLTAFAALGTEPIQQLSVTEARAQPTLADAVEVVLREQGRRVDPDALVPGVVSQDMRIVDGTLPARVYTPQTQAQTQGPLPVIVYFHGGGWVIGDENTYDASARGLADQADAIVVSVAYRQAPENRFPAAWEDALDAYRWVAANAASLGGDPQRLALAGESAGGNLAVATAVAVRDAGLPQPRHVLAVYPLAQTDSLWTPSYREHSNALPLNRAMVQWFFDKVLRSNDDKADPRLNLVDADLSGLPATTIVTAEIDPLRSDGEMLEDALLRAGVPVERRHYEGVMHEFFGAAAVIDQARQAQQYAGQRLQESLVGARLAHPPAPALPLQPASPGMR